MEKSLILFEDMRSVGWWLLLHFGTFCQLWDSHTKGTKGDFVSDIVIERRAGKKRATRPEI